MAQLRAVLPLLVGRTTSIGLAALRSTHGDGNIDDFDDSGGRSGGDLDSWLNDALSGTAEESVPGGDARVASTTTSSTTTAELGGAADAEASQSTTRPTPATPATASLLPSVRCGIEMALVHLAARAAGVSIGAAMSALSGLPCRGDIEINSLAARGEGSETSSTEVLM